MKKLGQGAITTGSGTLLYTVPLNYRTEVMDICLSNTTAAPITCAIHLVPVGVAVGSSNMLFPTVTIPGNTLIQWTGLQELNAGDFIQGIGSAAGITVNISGNELR
jgi:acyl dehydratase